MKGTRHSTPVVPAPLTQAVAKAEDRSLELKVPIVIAWNSGEREHERGDLVIGRAPDVDVVLDDSLVSRRHARLLVLEDGRVMVEDLGSANGVFVNGARLLQASGCLSEGDRVLIGTTELSLFSGRESGTLPIRRRASLDPSGAPRSIPIARVERASLGAKAASFVAPSSASTAAPTERSTVLGTISRLAGALRASGRERDALELVAEHLKKLRIGVSAGLPIPEDVLHEASAHALDLLHRTRDAAWLEYLIELHLVAQKVPSLTNLKTLEMLVETEEPIPRGRIASFVESLGVHFHRMSADERARFTALAACARRRGKTPRA